MVLVHLARAAYRIIRYAFLSDKWFDKITNAVVTQVENLLAGISAPRRGKPLKELKNLLEQIRVMEKAVQFAQNRSLLTRWAGFFFGVGMVIVFVYLATLFAFSYWGLACAYGVFIPFPKILVISLFHPLFATDLPNLLAVRALEGVHAALVLSLGFGTLYNYLNRKLGALQRTAALLTVRFEDKATRDKLRILKAAVEKLNVGDKQNKPTKK